MKNTRIVKEVIIDASKEKVWEVVTDFGGIYKASPAVLKSYLTRTKNRGWDRKALRFYHDGCLG